jgi:hypothetical protein
MYQIKLVEGKDAPTPNTQPHSDKGRTVGLLLRLCAGIASRGMVVLVLDDGVEFYMGGNLFHHAKNMFFWNRFPPQNVHDLCCQIGDF